MIDRFRGPHAFLSNFWPVEVVWKARLFTSVEHAYQAAKFDEPIIVGHIQDATSASEARFLGKRKYRGMARATWDSERLAVMEDLLRQKFATKHYRDLLLATGYHELVEGNTWGDDFWGRPFDDRGVLQPGGNHLGKLLMKIRAELRGDEAIRGAGARWRAKLQ